MKHLIFDIDGTLWDTTEVVAKAWNKALNEAGRDVLCNLFITGEMLKKEFGKPMNIIADDLFGDIDDKIKAEILKVSCKYEHEAILENNEDLTFEGVRETLKELSLNNKLYIVSNCQDGYVELVMKKNGFEDIIEDFECYGHTGLYKAENIKLLMERNNIKEAFYIGDTLGDFEASKEAGVKFIFAAYGFGEVKNPDYRIEKIEELLSLF